MLEVVSVPVSTGKGTVDCWMDIQRGEYPNVSLHKNNNSIIIFVSTLTHFLCNYRLPLSKKLSELVKPSRF